MTLLGVYDLDHLQCVQDHGFHFVFHREPTGLSTGQLEEYHGERSPLLYFGSNTAHSNRAVSSTVQSLFKFQNIYSKEIGVSLTLAFNNASRFSTLKVCLLC